MIAQSEAAPMVAVDAALRALVPGRWLLAVSGGRDSMVMLDAFARGRWSEVAAVATFDHGTGAAARLASELVVAEAAVRLLPVVTGVRSPEEAESASEAAWRAARWHFLARWARELGAVVVTAHTLDDQLETVLLRIIRGSGPRGLAGMSADGHGGPVPGLRTVRPLLGVRRADVADYAAQHHVRFVEDPSNVSRAHARNRARHDLLPALESASPGFGAWLLDLSTRATRWRADIDSLVDHLIDEGDVRIDADGTIVVRAGRFATFGATEWGVLWPALAARAGIAMDRRGVVRAAEWARRSAPHSRIQLAGAVSLERTASTFVLRRQDPPRHA
ncbi:MAG: tRNA lysidine(34) synthetase TilS [Gemmatimonadaceae bacterium]